MRLDQYLVEHGLVQSRERAKALIMAGTVYVNNNKEDKAGYIVPEKANVELRGKDLKYVSRGGLKLEKAILSFKIDLTDKAKGVYMLSIKINNQVFNKKLVIQ